MKSVVMDETLVLAKAIILEEMEKAGCKVERVLLFGSRVKGTARPESDWDFYVIIDKNLSFHEREDIASRICWRFAEVDLIADVFVQSHQTVEERRENRGYLTYYVLKEGVEI